jgi:hypothetical protein
LEGGINPFMKHLSDMDPLTKFKLEQLEELKVLLLERNLLKLAAEDANEAYARSNERVEFYLRSTLHDAYRAKTGS